MRPSALARFGVAVASAIASATLLAPSAQARPLEDIRARGELSVCANPNALPYASNRPELPGFQIEIARAIARQLGLRLQVEWIVPRMRAATVDCDMLMDTIARPEIQNPAIKLSVPYQTGGVALAFAPGQPTVARYQDLHSGIRVGVIMNSLASLIVSKTGARMVPFGFEDDMLEAVGKSEVGAAAVSPASIGYYNLTNPTRRVRLVHAEDSEPELKWTVAVGLRRADAPLVEAVNAAVAALIADGTIARIYAKYGVEHRRP
ncbi:MAG TPA: transporter substrate-binding domain-containing protein [Burkholderiales bacterium]|nr:transporter substrate-binding domain-containing protein [Burkholderiales bacterium]